VLTVTESMETHEVAKDQQLLCCAGFHAATFHRETVRTHVRTDRIWCIEVTRPTGYTEKTYGSLKKEVGLCHRRYPVL
jgi:hypothetical protein